MPDELDTRIRLLEAERLRPVPPAPPPGPRAPRYADLAALASAADDHEHELDEDGGCL